MTEHDIGSDLASIAPHFAYLYPFRKDDRPSLSVLTAQPSWAGFVSRLRL